jgi:hypothetical protein
MGEAEVQEHAYFPLPTLEGRHAQFCPDKYLVHDSSLKEKTSIKNYNGKI